MGNLVNARAAGKTLEQAGRGAKCGENDLVVFAVG